MIRLGLLTLLTLAILFLVLDGMGGQDLRAERAGATPAAPASAAQDAGAPTLTAPPSGTLPATPAVAVLPAASQTPERVQRFPGPPLEPSPEYPSGTPDAPQEAPEAGPVLYVTGDRVNMRVGPGTDFAVVTGLSGGTAVTPVGSTASEWVQVRTADGQAGFVAGRFLSPEAP